MIVNQTSTSPNFTSSVQMKFYTSKGDLLENFEVTRSIAGKIFEAIRNQKPIRDEFVRHDLEFKNNQSLVSLGHVDDFLITGKTAQERNEIGKKISNSNLKVEQLENDANNFGYSSDLNFAYQNRTNLKKDYVINSQNIKKEDFKDRIRMYNNGKAYLGDHMELQVEVEQNKGKTNIVNMLFKKAGNPFQKDQIDKIEEEYLINNPSSLSKKIQNTKTRRLRPTRARGVFHQELETPCKKIKTRKETPGQLNLFE